MAHGGCGEADSSKIRQWIDAQNSSLHQIDTGEVPCIQTLHVFALAFRELSRHSCVRLWTGRILNHRATQDRAALLAERGFGLVGYAMRERVCGKARTWRERSVIESIPGYHQSGCGHFSAACPFTGFSIDRQIHARAMATIVGFRRANIGRDYGQADRIDLMGGRWAETGTRRCRKAR